MKYSISEFHLGTGVFEEHMPPEAALIVMCGYQIHV